MFGACASVGCSGDRRKVRQTELWTLYTKGMLKVLFKTGIRGVP